MIIITTIIIIILIIYSSFLTYYNIKEKKLNNKKESYHKNIQQQQQYIQQLKQKKNDLDNNIFKQKTTYWNLVEQNNKYQKTIAENKKHLQNFYNNLKSHYEQGYLNYVNTLDKAYLQKEEQFQAGRESLKKSMDELKEELNALSTAKNREDQIKNNIDFYKIQITDRQKSDIQTLQEWKFKLFDPTIVSKIIWSSYIIKPTSDLCNRITQGKTICGIYKITSLISGKIYIGQSVNITQRIKSHIKSGLGIDASSTNKLYNLMQKEGVYNFTFEILQKCDKIKLNEREHFWIETYQSNKFGLNIQGGNK